MAIQLDKTRELALKILYKIDKEGAYSNIALNEGIKENKKELNTKDIGLISELTYGVTTWRLTLDEIIKKYSKIKIKKISPWILNILRMGIYQIVFLEKIPKSAAVNESVNLAKRYGHKSSSNFVNAILRKVNKQDYQELFEIKNPIQRISKTTSMPEWIVEQLLDDRKDVKKVEEICINLNERPKTIIRRNQLKSTKEEFENLLEEQQIEYENIEVNRDFYVVEKFRNIESLEIFKNGYFTVQDTSAGLSAYYLNPQKGDCVLDACSAPGGKTTYLAELMENDGYIEAWDIHKQRTNLVDENAKRLGINIIHTEQKDASVYDEMKKEKFDRILLDVPCLGIGVIKRKPDIKWKKVKDDVKEIAKIQYEILQTCSKYLKKSGVLVYSTCSIFKKENEDVIKKFLANNPEFELDNFCNNLKNSQYLDILPTKYQDGFFITRLKMK